MEWTKSLALGVEKLDKQHQELFRAMDRVVRIVDEKDASRSQRACIEAVKYLKNYTLMHFADEEAYMQEVGYGGYLAHKQIHDAFRSQIAAQEKKLEEYTYSRDVVMELISMIHDWLVGHIMRMDQRIAPGDEQS